MVNDEIKLSGNSIAILTIIRIDRITLLYNKRFEW